MGRGPGGGGQEGQGGQEVVTTLGHVIDCHFHLLSSENEKNDLESTPTKITGSNENGKPKANCMGKYRQGQQPEAYDRPVDFEDNDPEPSPS